MPTKSNINVFINAFKKRLGRTPLEYIDQKIKTGSRLDDVKYLFNILAAEISNRNNCKFFDFDYFYGDITTAYKPEVKTQNSQKTKRPENAGKFWSADEEQLLIKMYNNNAPKKEMCDTFKRTENGLAARLVKLGIIEDREVFRRKK